MTMPVIDIGKRIKTLTSSKNGEISTVNNQSNEQANFYGWPAHLISSRRLVKEIHHHTADNNQHDAGHLDQL
jgi:hypothetical protein